MKGDEYWKHERSRCVDELKRAMDDTYKPEGRVEVVGHGFILEVTPIDTTDSSFV